MYSKFEQLPIPLSARQRRQLFTASVNTLASHPEATSLLTRDLASAGTLRYPDGTPVMSVRLARLLHGPDPDEATRMRGVAAMGVFDRTLSIPPNTPNFPVPRVDAAGRKQIVECALAAFNAKLS